MYQGKYFVLFIMVIGCSITATAQDDIKKPALKDHKIADDLIVEGSSCVGTRCENGETFGHDTQRFKEDNLRIHFEDVSTTSGFPTEDWRIVINDVVRYGREMFNISDETNEIFTLEAGAPKNAIYVQQNESSKVEVGFGTVNPITSLHAVSGNTPALRLDQDGSKGFTPQAWDLAGNEAEFFIRDVTGGTRPFKLEPGTP